MWNQNKYIRIHYRERERKREPNPDPEQSQNLKRNREHVPILILILVRVLVHAHEHHPKQTKNLRKERVNLIKVRVEPSTIDEGQSIKQRICKKYVFIIYVL